MSRFPHAVLLALSVVSHLMAGSVLAGDPWVVYEGKEGPGKGKHIVFVTGDEEYRSEESMPQLAKILAERHGFRCTVLFAINPQTSDIDPVVSDNIPGLDKLAEADLMVMFLRFRELPDAAMQKIIDYTNSGKPIVALRTSTHPFFYRKNPDSPFAKWSWRSPDPQGGYGREVLGETWVAHHGVHNRESTRGVPADGMADHPILRGVESMWGPSDVYTINSLSGDSKPVVMGQVLVGMNPDDEVNTDKPPMPITWIKSHTGTEGKASRVCTTTMGHSDDMKDEGVRRMLVNACYWALGMEGHIPTKANVDLVGEYDPLPIGFGKHRREVKPADHAL
jgi:hypothetical protein